MARDLHTLKREFKSRQDGNSNEFNALRKVVIEMSDIMDDDYDRFNDEQIAEWAKKYIILYSKAKSAAAAYKAVNGNWQLTDVGKERMSLCNDFLEHLNSDLMTGRNNYGQRALGIEDIEDKTEVQKLAETLEIAEPDIRPLDLGGNRERKKFIKKHSHLHRLVQDTDDLTFMQNYYDNLETLETIKDCYRRVLPEGNDKDKLIRHVEIYERYFRTRLQLAKLPAEKRNEPERIKNERKYLNDEIQKLIKRGVDAPEKTYAKSADLVNKRTAAGNLVVYGKLLSGKYAFKKPNFGLDTLDHSVKARIGKIGIKYERKNWVKFSTAVSAGKAKVSTGGDLLRGITSFNDLNNTTTGVNGTAAAYGAKVKGRLVIGRRNHNLALSGKAIAGDAFATATAKAGLISYTDKDGNERHQYGAQFGATAIASAASASIGGSITILGVTVSLTNTFRAGAIGGTAAFNATTGSIGFSLGLSLGLGGDVAVSINWTQAKDVIKKWWNRHFTSKDEIEDKKMQSKLVDAHKLDSLEKVQSGQNHSDPEELLQSVNDRLEHATGTYKRILQEARKNLEEYIEFRANTYAAEDAMAALVCAKVIEKQRENHVAFNKSYENAIHSVQVKEVLNSIKHLNDRAGDRKMWDFSTPELRASSMSEERINQIAEKLTTERRPDANERANNAVHPINVPNVN